jgi:hypothetical protein
MRRQVVVRAERRSAFFRRPFHPVDDDTRLTAGANSNRCPFPYNPSPNGNDPQKTTAKRWRARLQPRGREETRAAAVAVMEDSTGCSSIWLGGWV